jgi:multifunctional methyltransferase subunit TRM112
MKLLTHNLLTSKSIKNVITGYPLKIVATKVEEKKTDFQPEFISRMLGRIDYKALYEAAQTVNKHLLSFFFFHKRQLINCDF